MRMHEEGQTLRFVEMEGKQLPDVACFNAQDLTEEINMADDDHHRLLERAVLFLRPHCSEVVNRIRYRVAGTRNCRDNFAMALKDWGFSARTNAIPATTGTPRRWA